MLTVYGYSLRRREVRKIPAAKPFDIFISIKHTEWDTLTAGVGLMGQARGAYTFFAHLKWTWAVALGNVTTIWAHLALNTKLF